MTISDFDPDLHQGKAVVTTIHKAKGLEWDRVYLLSVNNYDFPAGSPHDTYIAEKDFIRGQFEPAGGAAGPTAGGCPRRSGRSAYA